MKLKTKPGRFLFGRRLIALLVLAALALAARGWLRDNPQHNPWAPLEIEHPAGWATGTKIAALRNDLPACRAVLEREQLLVELDAVRVAYQRVVVGGGGERGV